MVNPRIVGGEPYRQLGDSKGGRNPECVGRVKNPRNYDGGTCVTVFFVLKL